MKTQTQSNRTPPWCWWDGKGEFSLGNALLASSRVGLTLSTHARHSISRYLLKNQNYMPVKHRNINLSSVFVPIAFYGCDKHGNQQQLGKQMIYLAYTSQPVHHLRKPQWGLKAGKWSQELKQWPKSNIGYCPHPACSSAFHFIQPRTTCSVAAPTKNQAFPQ